MIPTNSIVVGAELTVWNIKLRPQASLFVRKVLFFCSRPKVFSMGLIFHGTNLKVWDFPQEVAREVVCGPEVPGPICLQPV